MNFTKKALDQFKNLVGKNENPKAGIRFFTVQGCCSPYLNIDIVNAPSQGDKAMQFDDVNIFITPEAEKILANITLDYSENSFYSVKESDEPFKGRCC